MRRTELREHIFKMIFSADFNDQALMKEQIELYLQNIEGIRDDEFRYLKDKAERILAHQEEIDSMINEHATGWKTSRMNKVDLSILRLAVYEMILDEDVPNKVAINEAVELAKSYSGDDGPSFINGVLGKISAARG